jgi:hypothetical protein
MTDLADTLSALERSPWGAETSETLRKAIVSALEEIQRGLEALGEIDVGALAVDMGIILLGGPLAAGALAFIRHKWADNISDAVQKFSEVAGKIATYLVAIGDPWQLHDAAGMWSRSVREQVSKQAAWFDNSQMQLTEYWTGDAKDAYTELLPSQSAALKDVSAIAGSLNEPLTECATNIGSFWCALGTCLVDALAGLARALNGILSPDFLAKPGEIVEVVITGHTSAFDALVEAMNGFLKTFAVLEERLTNNEAFPGGHWPKSKEVLGDTFRWDAQVSANG